MNTLNELILYPIFKIPFAVLFIFSISIFLLLYLRFVNFRKDPISRSYKKNKAGISKFSAFMSSAAGTLGVGNIFGGAMCVTIAGAGSIFWILILGFFASIIKFCEVYLGHKYRVIKNNNISGGSFFYIKNCFKSRFSKVLAIFYATLFFIAYLAAGTFQIHQISDLLSDTFFKSHQHHDIFKLSIGTITAILTGVILFGGIKKIANILSKVVPLMVCLYCISASWICIIHHGEFMNILKMIFNNAFENKVQSGGLLFVISYSLHRILFASDTGTGVSSIANSQSNVSAFNQAKLVAFEPILVSFTMCITGFCVLITNSHEFALQSGELGVKIASMAFSQNIITKSIFILVVCLFGITTTVSHGYNIEQAWKYITKNKAVYYCRLLYACMIIFISTKNMKEILPIIDLAFFLCIILNLLVMLKFAPEIKRDLVGK